MPFINKDSSYNNPLKRWKKNQFKFPILARLARMYLSIQATLAPSLLRSACLKSKRQASEVPVEEASAEADMVGNSAKREAIRLLWFMHSAFQS